VAGAQIIKKFLAQIGHRIHVQDEKVRPIVHDEVLGLFQTLGEIDLGGRRRVMESGPNLSRELPLWLKDKNTPARLDGISGVRWSCFVHNLGRAGRRHERSIRAFALFRDACFPANEKHFSLPRAGDILPDAISQTAKKKRREGAPAPIVCAAISGCGHPP
jgi:hypothetical protein